jgi:hypothetical protein
VDLSKYKSDLGICLMAKADKGWIWHRRLGHVSMRRLNDLQRDDHVVGLTNITFYKNRECFSCNAGNQVGGAHIPITLITTSRPLELLHM